MTRDEKIAALKQNLSDIELQTIREIVVSATHFFLVGVCEKCRDQGPVDSIEDTLHALAEEFR